jgi:hypothetical protein
LGKFGTNLSFSKFADKELSLNWGVADFLLKDFCNLLLAIDRAIKRVITDKNRYAL